MARNTLRPEDLAALEYLTVQQACVYAQVSRRTLYNWMGAGRVGFVRTPGGCRRLLRASLLQVWPVDVAVPAPPITPSTPVSDCSHHG